MNTKQSNTLRGLLKKYGIKDASNMVRLGMDISLDKLLRESDPLYIVPRIAFCYEEIKQDIFCTLYKEWIKDVVEYEWLDQLNGYIEESGTRAVTQALYYLIDNDLWQTYEGRLGLGQQESNKDYYKGLADIPSAIAKVMEINPDLAPKDEAKSEEKPQLASSQEEVVRAAMCADTAIESLIDNVRIVVDYVKANVDTSEAKKQLDEARKQLADKDRTIRDQAADIARMKEEATKQDGYYRELHDKYNALLDERDAISKENDTYAKMLEEAAQKEQMPKKKVIPESVLLGVPLLGYGVLKGLRFALEKYNIIIDPNR